MTGSILTFPPRYTPERLDYAFVLVDSNVEPWEITAATVTAANGDIVVSDVNWDGNTVTFWLEGGTPIYQRLVCIMETDSTPPRTYEIQATIACYP